MDKLIFLPTCVLILLLIQTCSGLTNNVTIRSLFTNPVRDDNWPDPFCYLHTDGFYYMPRSENDGIVLYKSPILHNWRTAERAHVYQSPEGLMNLWAPEIFYIGGNWYMYFALDDGDNANHRMYVIRAVFASNPMGEWTTEKRMAPTSEDYWAIDGTVLEYGNGQLYFLWSGWPTIDAGFPQNIYIAPMSDPETISGPRVLINEPTLPWQQIGAPLLEAPQILHNAGRVFVVYSCSGSWTPDYQMGFMGIDNLADPLDPENWWYHDQPVFWRNDAENVFGVGHASFTTSKDGTENWIVYHAMAEPDAGWLGRTARVQTFQWNSDNSPWFPRPVGFTTSIFTPISENTCTCTCS